MRDLQKSEVAITFDVKLINFSYRLKYGHIYRQLRGKKMVSVLNKRCGPFLFAQILLLGLLGLSCSSPKLISPTPQSGQTVGARGGTITYRLSSPPTTFNYLLASDEPTVVTSFFLLNSRLIDFDHRTQKYTPALAESWKISDDEITVEVKLRDGLKFSDGSEVTADDVAFTLKAIYDERTNSPAWKDAMLVNNKQITATVADKVTVKLTFPEKVAGIENYLINLGVLPHQPLKAAFDAGKLAEAWKINADPKIVVTSGPFMVESASAGERVTLVRNPYYWKKDNAGTQLPYLDKLVLEIIPDPNNAIARLNQNVLDIIDRIRPSDYASLKSTPGTVNAVDVGPGLGTDHLWFNLNKAKSNGERLDGGPKYAWFNDKRFRQAVSMAIDRDSITTTTLRGLATPTYGFVSPANRLWADPAVPTIEYNLEKAGQLLTDAGFTKRGEPAELFDQKNNRVEFTLIVPAENEPRKLMAAVIQQDLASLGIKMQIAPVEFQNVTERWVKSFDYDAILLGLSITDTEPSSYGNFLLSGAATHQWQPVQKTPSSDWEKRIDQLFAEQAREADPQKRAALFNEIQKIMAVELPVIPIVSRHVVSAANTRIGNYAPSPIVPYSLWNAEELYIRQ